MKTAKLGEVAECLDRMRVPVTEADRTPGDVPYYGANGQQGWIDQAIFNEPLVIVAEDGGHFSNPARGVAYRIDGPAWVNNHGHVLRATPQADTDFLFRVLQNYNFQPYISGSTRSKLTQKQLLSAEIPLPPLSEQRRIAAILDHVDALRAKRREVITHLEALPAAIFLDMFGDPARNPFDFPLMTIRSIAAKFSDGPFGSNLKSSHYVDSGVPVVRLQNIGVGQYLDHDRAFISEEHYAKLSKHDCLPGDILIGTLGDPNLRACIQPRSLPRALNKADCIQFRTDPHVADALWACWLLNMPGTLSLASSLAHGQTRTRIAMGQLRELKVPVPPINLQHQFAEKVAQVTAQQASESRSRTMLDELFASLQSRAFRGEL